MHAFSISETGKRAEVVKRLREGYADTGVTQQIAALLATSLEHSVADASQMVSVALSGHVVVHPRHSTG